MKNERIKVKCKILLEDGVDTGYRAIRDMNDNIIAIAKRRTMEDYIDECLHGNNECAMLLDVFERYTNGKDAKLWVDYETNEYFISY